MSAPSFTPGPWVVLGNSVGGPAIYTADGKSCIASVRTVGGVHVGGPQHPETDANAHLLAAAPDLLEALQMFARYEAEAERGDDVSMMITYAELRKAAHAAIAKATGSQP